jgi:UDP-glucose 4-epimerase
MRVLITGGGGNLGRVLAPTLEEVGHEPILMDNRTLETPHKAVRGDVRDRDSVLEVFRETDVVVHAAALHGIHLEKYTTDDFWDLNVVGTLNVYEAARELGIGKILLCSTMGVYGDGVDRPCEQDVDSRGSGGRNTLPPDALMGTEAWCRGHLHPELRSTPTVRFRASYL